MPHFKDEAGNLFWLDDQDVTQWRANGWEQITEEEAQAIRAANAPVPDRRAVISARLMQIDAESVRPSRELVSAQAKGKTAPAFALNKMEALEAEAEQLRAELKALQ